LNWRSEIWRKDWPEIGDLEEKASEINGGLELPYNQPPSLSKIFAA